MTQPATKVCDGCWRRGFCIDPRNCLCPCTKAGWKHADDPTRKTT